MADTNRRGLLGNFMSPETMGLLGAAAGLLRASGPSTTPTSLGQAMSQGIQGGLQGYQQGQTLQDAGELRRAQLEKLKRDKELQDWALSQLGYGQGATQPGQPPVAPGVPQETPPGMSPSTSAGLFGSTDFASPTSADSGSNSKYSFGDSDSVPPSIAAKRGAGFGPGIDQNAALYAMTGHPGLAKIGGWMQDASKPIPVPEGGALMGRDGRIIGSRPKLGENVLPILDAQGNVVGVRPMPGAADAAASITGAQEGARAGFDMIEVPVIGGGTQLLPRSVVAGRLGGGQPQQPQIPPFPTNLPMLPQGQQAGIPGPSQAGGFGFKRPASEMGAEAEFAKTMATGYAKTYQDIALADRTAPATITKYQRLGSLLGQVKTGKFTATTTQLKAAAKSVGIDLGALGITDDVPQAQAALALSNQLAIELRNPQSGGGMPGALSDKDREFLVQMVPGLENDPASIPLMIEYRTRLAKRDRDVARLAREYRKRNGGRFDDGFDAELAEWSDKNPLFTEADRAKLPSGGFRVIGVTRPGE